MGKSNNKTTTEQTQPPSWVGNLQQTGIGSAYGAILPYLTQGYGAAAPNPDEQAAFGMIRQNAAAPPLIAWSPAQAASVTGAQVAAAPTVDPAVMAAARAAQQQLGADEYRPFLNPYTRDVVNTTTAQMRKEQDANLNAIRARGAAAHSFAGAGSRAALTEAKSIDDFNQRVASTTAQLMSQGYDRATASALANAQMRQQTALTNAGFEQQANQANAGYTQQARLSNAEMQQGRNFAQAGFDQQTGLTNAGYTQQANLFNATGANNVAGQNIGYRQQALQQLLGIGQLQQQQAQSALDRPLQAATTLAGILPQNVGATKRTTAPSTSPSTLQTILGLAGTVGGAYLGGPMGASAGASLGQGLGSLFGGGTLPQGQLDPRDDAFARRYGFV